MRSHKRNVRVGGGSVRGTTALSRFARARAIRALSGGTYDNKYRNQ